MSYPQTKYKVSNSATDSGDNSRNLSAVLWRSANEQYAPGHPESGHFLYDDFDVARVQVVDTAVDGWWLEEEGAASASAEAFDSSTLTPADGVVRLAATTGTDWQGVKVHRGAAATSIGRAVCTPKHTTTPKGDVIYETRVYLNLQANDTLFVGLAEAIATFLSNVGVLPTTCDYVGFYRLDAGDLKFVIANDNNGGTAVAQAITIVAAASIPEDAWVKLGFRINADFSVEICYNGQIVNYDTSGTKIAVTATSIPIENLTETKCVLRGATGDNATVSLDTDFDATFVAP